MKFAVPAIAAWGAVMLAVVTCSPEAGTDFPVSIAYVREMGHIPEVDGWEHCAPALFTADSQAAAAEWDTLHAWVSKRLPPATIRGLSGWAKKQMASYEQVPPFRGIPFTPIRCRRDQKKLVLEAVADTLPSHDRSVTRYLKLFLLYDTGEKRIIRVTATIRGELSE